MLAQADLDTALLALWSRIGSAVGSAVAGAVWGDLMPVYLRQELPASVSNADVRKYFGNIRTIKTLAFDSPTRLGAIAACMSTIGLLYRSTADPRCRPENSVQALGARARALLYPLHRGILPDQLLPRQAAKRGDQHGYRGAEARGSQA